MSGIHDAIQKTKCDFIMKTGKEPEALYLGDEEITALLSWAEENQYISSAENEPIEGDHRPEVAGLLVYVVNAPSHIKCA